MSALCHERSLGSPRLSVFEAVADSLCPDVRCLDDRPPLLDFGLLKSAERFLPARTCGREFKAWSNMSLAGNQILHCRSSTAIGHELKARTGLFLEISATDVRWAAHACSSLRGLAWIRLQPRDQFIQALCGRSVLCDDELRIACEQRDRLEIIQHVVLKRVDSPVQHMRAQEADAESITIGYRTHDAAHADGPSGASYVFNDDGLAERDPHALGHNAPDRIRRPASRKRHNHRDRARRVGLRLLCARREWPRRSAA